MNTQKSRTRWPWKAKPKGESKDSQATPNAPKQLRPSKSTLALSNPFSSVKQLTAEHPTSSKTEVRSPEEESVAKQPAPSAVTQKDGPPALAESQNSDAFPGSSLQRPPPHSLPKAQPQAVTTADRPGDVRLLPWNREADDSFQSLKADIQATKRKVDTKEWCPSSLFESPIFSLQKIADELSPETKLFVESGLTMCTRIKSGPGKASLRRGSSHSSRNAKDWVKLVDSRLQISESDMERSSPVAGRSRSSSEEDSTDDQPTMPANCEPAETEVDPPVDSPVDSPMRSTEEVYKE